jgi:hypothetical protein
MRRLSVALAVRLISMMSLPVTVAAVAPPAFGRDLDGRNAASPRHDCLSNFQRKKVSAVRSPTAMSWQMPTGEQRTVTIACVCPRPSPPTR